MTDTKFTPGPWTFDTSEEWPMSIGSQSDDVLFGCGCCGSPNLSRDDAHLIAAAPDLYEALEDVMLNGIDGNNITRVAAALAKARGDHSPSG